MRQAVQITHFFRSLFRRDRLETTAQYARVDRRALRELARPWPGSAV